MFARTESNASRTLRACGPPSWSTMATRASWIFPPKALPRMINCTSGKIIDASINAGERKNLRISRSTMAIMRFINTTPQFGFWRPAAGLSAATFRKPGAESRKPFRSSWLQPRPLRHYEGVGLLQFVAKLSSGVMHEHVVESGVLHRERLHRHLALHGHLHQFGCSA